MQEPYNFISVIVPCLNSESTIDMCISSLLQQEYPPEHFELIFVDDGSNDRTVELIKKYPVKLLREEKKNPFIARNKGVQNSNGNVLAFTDSNCEVDKGWLSTINENINEGFEAIQGPGSLTKQTEILPRAECNLLIMKKEDYWGDTKNFAILKSVFNEVGGFPCHTSGDSLIVYELKKLNYKIKYDENLKVYREYSTKFSVLLGKNWKYGKGDVAIDYHYNRLNWVRKLFQSLKYSMRFFIKIPTARNFDDLMISVFYYHTMKVTRAISYIVNFKTVVNNCTDSDNCRSY